MAIINEDIILELAQYPDILTLLSLAHSWGVAFRASQKYSFWSPHELDSSVGLATFLPEDHVGSWRSYSGNELRQAVIGMRNFKERWGSERVSATRRVHLGRYTSLEVIPGSRWFYNFNHGTSAIIIVDGKTGMSTMEDLVVSSVGETYTEVTHSPEPNRILIGWVGENEEEIWGFVLFEIILSVNENAGRPYVGAQATQIRLWEKFPEPLTVLMTPEFLVTEPDSTDLPGWNLHIYHIPSSRRWEWNWMSEQQKPTLVDPWCVLTTGQRTGTIFIVAIHLPSLMSHPESTRQILILPEGATLNPGPDWRFRRRIDVLQSPHIPLPRGGSSEYTVMLSDGGRRSAFDIRLEIVPGSLYGNVTLTGTESALPNDLAFESQPSSHIIKSLLDRPPSPRWFTATQRDFDVLETVFDSKNYIKTLRMVDLGKSGHSRMLDWKVPLKIRAGSDATAEMDYQGDPDEIRALPAWNTRVGMLLLNGHPLPGGVQEYQTCWF